MQVLEITGYATGIAREGVNFLEPADAFQNIQNGFIYRQVLQSRKGFKVFSTGRLSDGSRIMGIFEFIKPDDTKDLLVCTKDFLYKYNTGTDTFDQIPMAGAAPLGGFGITNNEDYVSGTSYPTKTNTQRFIFCSRGMTDIYFYDGTDVKVFTNAADNLAYQAPAAGALSKATYVAWFGERLNFFVPVIAGVQQSQMVLYSGIRTTSGNGDKFNVAGSGSLSADTYEYMTGAIIAGDYMVLNFNRSNWTLEKTRDAFNPYFIRRVPGVVGTDASFSGVSWANDTESIGKTGIIATDGKQSLRNDNRIPYFTRDEIDQIDFDLIYGGFDRTNAQFLFAYRSADSNLSDITQDKVLVHNYEETSWSINDMRFSVFGQTDKGEELVMNQIDETQDPSWERMDTTEEVWNKIGIGETVQKTLAGDNQGFVYELNADYDDYFVPITAISQASSAVITLDPCALQIGDLVSFENVGGMVEINGLTATVLSIGLTSGATTSITVDIDSSLFTAYTTGGSVSKIISFYAETIPFNPFRSQGRRVYVSHAEFLLNTNTGNLLIDVFSDEDDTPFKSNVLLQPTDTQAAREWITMTVDQESDFITFAMKQQSAGEQVLVTSMRIHYDMGGFTSA